MKNNKALVSYVKSKLGALYWYGTFGQKASPALYRTKKLQYPSQYLWLYTSAMTGKQCFDCIGLIKSYLWTLGDKIVYCQSQDLSANAFFKTCTKTGKIKDIPDVPGLLVWRDGHIGVYIGGGYVIEARGHKYGVVKTKLAERDFKKYGYCRFIQYIEDKPAEKPKEKPATKYFKKYGGKSLSIVDALKAIKEKSSYKYRAEIAAANGIKGYTGAADENEKLLKLLKAGKLIKP